MDLRQKIIAATEEVVLKNGLAKTTTKEIARAAGCAEGSIYNHFQNKEELFFHVLRAQLSNLMNVMISLPERIGTGSVREHLKHVVTTALEDFHRSMPFTTSVFYEPGLLQRHREGFISRNEGPHRANEALGSYLQEEQKNGRVNSKLHTRAIADMLLGAAFHKAFQLRFLDVALTEEMKQQFADQLLDNLL